MAKASIKDYLSVRAAGSPTFNASGTRIAYRSNVDSDTYQIHWCDLTGSDASRLTDFDDAVGFVDMSPTDDSLLLFTKDTGGNEMTGLFFMNVTDGSVTTIAADPGVQFVPGGWSRDGQFILYSSNARNKTDRDLFIYDIELDTHVLLYEGEGSNTPLGFSPSGRYVVFSRWTTNVASELYLIDRQRAAGARRIVPTDGTFFSSAPRWTSDESGFFYMSNESNEFTCLRYYDIRNDAQRLVHDYGWDVEALFMSRASDELFVWVNEDGYSALHMYTVDGARLHEAKGNPFAAGDVGSMELSPDGTMIAYNLSAFNRAGNVWLSNRTNGNNTQLTDVRLPVDASAFVEPELARFEARDKLSIPLFVYRPNNATRPTPAIVYIHGGPEEQFRPQLWVFCQYWLSIGYSVLAPNVRGSSGYGRTYLALDDKTLRLDSVEDLRDLHSWAVNDPLIDSKRLALMGASYGGYMVLAGLAFQPDLWAAGVDIIGIANFVTYLERTSSYRRALRESEYGSLTHDRDFLVHASPINKSDEIVAPLFIIHGANDPRVPLFEAEQIHDKLRNRGIMSTLLVYDDEGHGLAKLKNRLDAYPKVAEFLQKAFKA